MQLFYNEAILGKCFGLLPEGESIEQHAKDHCNWLLEKAEERWNEIRDDLGNFSLGW